MPTSSLVRALLDALASMYYHRDGPWLDELRQTVLNDPDASYIDRMQSAAMIDQTISRARGYASSAS